MFATNTNIMKLNHLSNQLQAEVEKARIIEDDEFSPLVEIFYLTLLHNLGDRPIVLSNKKKYQVYISVIRDGCKNICLDFPEGDIAFKVYENKKLIFGISVNDYELRQDYEGNKLDLKKFKVKGGYYWLRFLNVPSWIAHTLTQDCLNVLMELHQCLQDQLKAKLEQEIKDRDTQIALVSIEKEGKYLSFT